MTSFPSRSEWWELIEALRDTVRNHWGISSFTSVFGTHGIEYGEEDGMEYASLGFILPDGMYAEIEDGTYGQLNAFRIFRSDEHD